ncbi:MAG: hypothetical protein V1789_07960 [PVC group bacterium]
MKTLLIPVLLFQSVFTCTAENQPEPTEALPMITAVGKTFEITLKSKRKREDSRVQGIGVKQILFNG